MKHSEQQCNRRRGFTLVELMVVIVIIAIILGITAPAFQRLATGNAVDSAARMVSSQLSLARAEAVSRRQYVAVIMPGQTFAQDTANDTNIYRYQSFRAAIVEASATAGQYTFVQWVEGTDWTFLPTGALIAEADGDAYDDGSVPVGAGVDKLELINTASAGSPIQLEVPVDSNGDSRWKIEDNGSVVVTDAAATEKIYPGKANDLARAVIFKPNGRCVQKTFVTILEGVVATPAGNIERENKHNIRVMEINAYTGQIRFLY